MQNARKSYLMWDGYSKEIGQCCDHAARSWDAGGLLSVGVDVAHMDAHEFFEQAAG